MKSLIFLILITFILSIQLNFTRGKKEEDALFEMKKLPNLNLLIQSLKSIKKDLENVKNKFNKSIENLGDNFFSEKGFNYFDEDILVKNSKVHYIRNILKNSLYKFGYEDYISFFKIIEDNLELILENNWVHIYFIFNNRLSPGKLNCFSVFVNKNKNNDCVLYDFIFIKIKSNIRFKETLFLSGIYNAKNGNNFEKEDFHAETILGNFKDKIDSIILLYRLLTYKYLLNIFSIDFPLFE